MVDVLQVAFCSLKEAMDILISIAVSNPDKEALQTLVSVGLWPLQKHKVPPLIPL
jgi:hypothetical protein